MNNAANWALFKRADKAGDSYCTSCAVQLHVPLCAVIVSLVTFTIA